MPSPRPVIHDVSLVSLTRTKRRGKSISRPRRLIPSSTTSPQIRKHYVFDECGNNFNYRLTKFPDLSAPLSRPKFHLSSWLAEKGGQSTRDRVSVLRTSSQVLKPGISTVTSLMSTVLRALWWPNSSLNNLFPVHGVCLFFVLSTY